MIGAALALRERHAASLLPSEEVNVRELLSRLREALGPEETERCISAGQRLQLAEALAEVRAALTTPIATVP